jgi:DNA-directed RNA polymerase subunit D
MFHDYVESGPSLLCDTSQKIRASFRLAPSNTVLANTLRRQILVDVPTVGFRTEPAEKSEVIIEHNTTPLMNEMIAHRIGMIPICADPDTFDPHRYEFAINIENNTKNLIDVRAANFIIREKNPENPLDEGRILQTRDFFPPDPLTGDTCLITRLRPQWNPTAADERLILRARATVSTGRENIRWSPVSQCSFENTLDDNAERRREMFYAWLDKQKKIPDPSSIASERLAEFQREYDTMEVKRCFRVDERGEPNDFTFCIESIGAMSIPKIVTTAIQSTIDKLAKYRDIDAILPENVSIRHGDTLYASIDFIFSNEDHTLGNLLQNYLVEHHVEGGETPSITFAGYKVPHPLKAEMALRVGLGTESSNPEADIATARLAVASVCRRLSNLFQKLASDWNAVTAQITTQTQTTPSPTEIMNDSPDEPLFKHQG